jgi:hypothetical protein
MSSHTLMPGTLRVTPSRPAVALALAVIAVALMIAGGLLPWLSLFNGLTTVQGFSVDGGILALVTLAVVALLFVQARHGGAGILRPIAILASMAIVADSLYSAWRITAYAGDPGPTGVLTSPAPGAGPYVFAAAGAVLVVAAAIAPAAPGRLGRAMTARLVLALLLLTAAIIHLTLTPEHLEISLLLGVGFLLAGFTQLALAALVLGAPERGDLVMSAVVVVSVALIVIYAYAVLVGLPLEAGHEAEDAIGWQIGAGEPVDMKGVVDFIAEVAAVALAVVIGFGAARIGMPRTRSSH